MGVKRNFIYNLGLTNDYGKLFYRIQIANLLKVEISMSKISIRRDYNLINCNHYITLKIKVALQKIQYLYIIIL